MKANVEILREKPKRFHCSSGEPDRELFVLDGDHLICVGVENTQALIESYEESTDLNLILERVAAGELDLLTKRTGLYIDCTQFPTTVCELKNSIRQNEVLFESLPDDVKADLGSFKKLVNMDDKSYKQFIDKYSSYVEPVHPDIPVPFESEVSE